MNWMTSAKRRAQLKRKATKHNTVLNSQSPLQSANLVRHNRFPKDREVYVSQHTMEYLPGDRAKRSKPSIEEFNSTNISRDILFLQKSPSRLESSTTNKQNPICIEIAKDHPKMHFEDKVIEDMILLYNDGHRVNEDGSFVQGDISLWRVNAAPTICDDTANNFAQTYFVTDWPQRLYSLLMTLGQQHKTILEVASKKWIANKNTTPTEVLPSLYGAMNGGPISNTSPSDMSNLLDLIRYVEITEKCSSLQINKTEAFDSNLNKKNDLFGCPIYSMSIDNHISEVKRNDNVSSACTKNLSKFSQSKDMRVNKFDDCIRYDQTEKCSSTNIDLCCSSSTNCNNDKHSNSLLIPCNYVLSEDFDIIIEENDNLPLNQSVNDKSSLTNSSLETDYVGSICDNFKTTTEEMSTRAGTMALIETIRGNNCNFSILKSKLILSSPNQEVVGDESSSAVLPIIKKKKSTNSKGLELKIHQEPHQQHHIAANNYFDVDKWNLFGD